MVEYGRCFLARAKICRAVKIFVYVSKSAQTWPEIQPQVELYIDKTGIWFIFG